MFILFMDRKGMLLTHAVPHGQTVNSEYYSKVDTRIQVNLILVELFGKYVPVHYLGLDWQLNKVVSFSELVPNLASVPNKINRLHNNYF
jgi:hypothetical protein